ncbi:MAG: DUF1189 family protein [Alphaproteobacteria bacterium]|nr:DUF1189 family protein [Alphaproteobacteria bacterium]
MNRLNEWLYPFVGAFFDKHLYQEAVHVWRAVPFPIIIIAVIIGNLPGMLVTQNLIQALRDEAYLIIDQLPPLKLANGELSTTITQPKPLYNSSHKQIGVFNPKPTNPSLDEHLLFAINPKELVFATPQLLNPQIHEISHTSYPSHYNGDVTASILKHQVDLGYVLTKLILPLFVLCLMFFVFILEGVLVAIIGLGLSHFQNKDLSIKPLFRIAIIALLPTQVISCVFAFAGIEFNYQPYVLFISSLFFLYFGIHASQSDKKN